MTAEEALARSLCEADGADPSWPRYMVIARRKSRTALAALAAAGFVVVQAPAPDEDPLPCHCGSFIYLSHMRFNTSERYAVSCSRCESSAAPTFASKREAIADWNTRQRAVAAAQRT